MSRRILFICSLALFIISACGKSDVPSEQKLIQSEPVKATATKSVTTETEQINNEDPASEPLVADKEAGKLLADKCKTCHGDDGNKSIDGSPYISGQQTEYMLSALQSYTNGDRIHEEMKTALESLTEADLFNLATYYNDQTPNWKQIKPVSRAKAKTIAVNKRTIAQGKKKATQCTGCHGEKGRNPIEGAPALAGMPTEYFRSAMLAYFKGERREQKVIMKMFKNSISKTDINHLAAYFSVQTAQKPPKPTKGSSKSGKKLAVTACNGCHGVNGNSDNPSIPSLTGQNAHYLVTSLNAYKNGLRKNTMMKDATKNLNSSQIINLAAHYAKQTPKLVGTRQAKPSKGFDPIGDGANIATSCNGCHGAKGNSTLPGTPSLSGLDPKYLAAAINMYKNGQRKHSMMKGFVTNLSDSDIEKVALYYASQEPTAMSNRIKANVADGESLASACTTCHGDLGNSTQPDTPSIAGQEPSYLITAINDYKSGNRENESMKNAVLELGNATIKNFAAYFAAQKRNKLEVRIPEAPEVLAQKCYRCHGDKGMSTDSKVPRLAGQVESYLLGALREYNNETRKQSTMHAMSANLSPLERKAISKYLAQQK